MIDPDCAICCSLTETIESLTKIVSHIEWSCAHKRSKSDFGLTKNNILEKIGEIKKLEKYHQYFHSTGESLMETNNAIDSSTVKPKRWRKA